MYITFIDATFAVVKSKLVKFRLVQDPPGWGGGGQGGTAIYGLYRYVPL